MRLTAKKHTCTRAFSLALSLALLTVPFASTSVFAAGESASHSKPKPASGTYAIDPTHTMVLVQWSHFGFSRPSANFPNAQGFISYDAQNVSNSLVEVTFPVADVDSFVPALDAGLRSATFFDVENYPTATFKSTSVKSFGPTKLLVKGNLTVKNFTKEVVLSATLNGAGVHPMTQRQAIGFDAYTTLKRSDFGVGAYAPAVSDEVTLRITTEAQKVD